MTDQQNIEEKSMTGEFQTQAVPAAAGILGTQPGNSMDKEAGQGFSLSDQRAPGCSKTPLQWGLGEQSCFCKSGKGF